MGIDNFNHFRHVRMRYSDEAKHSTPLMQSYKHFNFEIKANFFFTQFIRIFLIIVNE